MSAHNHSHSGAGQAPYQYQHAGAGSAPYQPGGYAPSAPSSGTYAPPPPPQYVAPNESGTYAPTGYPQATPYNTAAGSGAPNAYYGGAPNMGAPQGPASLPHPHAAAPSAGGTLHMSEAGAFSDMGSKIQPVPAATVTAASAGARLVDLKRKFNELQRKRASYHSRQAANGGVAVASVLLTVGTSLLFQGPAAIHQRNRLQQIVRAMRECVVQINALRKAFAHTPGWHNAERVVQCDREAFTKALNRQELHGDL